MDPDGRGRWELSPVTVALAPVALGLVGNLATSTVAVDAWWWAPLSWTVTGLLTVVMVVSQVAQSRTVAADRQTRLTEAAALLRVTVAGQWRDEAVRVLGLDTDPMPVRWALTPRPTFARDGEDVVIGGGTAASLPADRTDELAAAFRALDHRRLVILGGPGAGKTTLAIQLIRTLVDRPGEGEPVPVLLTMQGWDPDRLASFEDWLTARLVQGYPFLAASGTDTARALFRGGMILPVLDGLDEVPAELLPGILTEVNRSLAASDQIVLTCRTREYAAAVAAGQSIAAAAIAQAEPLPGPVVADHLAGILARTVPHPGWDAVLAALRTGDPAPLAEVASTPLGLWLIRTTCLVPGSDPTPLAAFPSAGALRTHLFDRLVPELLRVRPPAGPDDAPDFRPGEVRDSEQVMRWLRYLARLLDRTPSPVQGVGRRSTGVRDFAWWRLTATATDRQPPGRLGAAAVLAAAVAWGWAVGWMTGLERPLWWVVGGMALVLAYREGDSESWIRHLPAYADLRLRGRNTRLVRAIALGLALPVGMTVALGGLALALGLFWKSATAGITEQLLVLIPGFVLTGLVDGIVRWAETPIADGSAATPVTSWRADRALNLLRLALGAVLGGVIGALATGLAGLSPGRIAVGAALTTLAGAVYGLVSGRRHAWLTNVITVAGLARRGLLPRRFIPFLADAHRLGLLRQVGPVYQFRHAEFQDHLAARRSARGPALIPVRTAALPVMTLTPTPQARFRTPIDVNAVAFTLDGTRLVVTGPGKALLSGLDGRVQRRYSFDRRMALLQKAASFVLNTGPNTVFRRDITGFAGIAVVTGGERLALSPDGTQFATIGPDSGTHTWIIDVATGARRRIRYSGEHGLAFSPDSTRLATSSGFYTRVWNPADGTEPLVLNPAGAHHRLAFHPGGTRLATASSLFASQENRIQVWDLETEVALLHIPGPADGETTDITYSPDGTILAAASSERVHVYDAATGEELHRLDRGAHRLAFHPDGTHLAVARDVVVLWNLAAGDQAPALAEEANPTGIAFSPDGALLAVTTAARTLHLIHLRS
ncbi:hypothetical protein [Streptomyces sp. NPDC004270]